MLLVIEKGILKRFFGLTDEDTFDPSKMYGNVSLSILTDYFKFKDRYEMNPDDGTITFKKITKRGWERHNEILKELIENGGEINEHNKKMAISPAVGSDPNNILGVEHSYKLFQNNFEGLLIEDFRTPKIVYEKVATIVKKEAMNFAIQYGFDMDSGLQIYAFLFPQAIEKVFSKVKETLEKLPKTKTLAEFLQEEAKKNERSSQN